MLDDSFPFNISEEERLALDKKVAEHGECLLRWVMSFGVTHQCSSLELACMVALVAKSMIDSYEKMEQTKQAKMN